MHVGLERVHGILNDQLDANGGGQMEHDVRTVDELGHHEFTVEGWVDRFVTWRSDLVKRLAELPGPATSNGPSMTT